MAIAKWPKLEHVMLTCQDLDVAACDVLGVCRAVAAGDFTSAQRDVFAPWIKEDHICVHPEGSVFLSIKWITLML